MIMLPLQDQKLSVLREPVPHKGDSMLNVEHLRGLNTAQLLHLLEDEEKMRETIRVNPKFQHLQNCKKILLETNCWLAERNLAHQPHLKDSKLLLADRYQILGQMVSSVRRKQRRLETFQQKLSLRAMDSLLQESIGHSVSQSKDLWQKFTAGKLLLTDFIESLRNSQMLCHRTLLQAEKIQNLIRRAQVPHRDVDFLHPGHVLLHPVSAVRVFSPVVLLPHFSPACLLPPLKQRTCGFSQIEWSPPQGVCDGSETLQRSQRSAALRPLDNYHTPWW